MGYIGHNQHVLARGYDCRGGHVKSEIYTTRRHIISVIGMLACIQPPSRASENELDTWVVSPSERTVAIQDVAGRVVANGILWNDEGIIVSSYIPFKDYLRKNQPLTGVFGLGRSKGQEAFGTLSLAGFDPSMDLVVFRCDDLYKNRGLSLSLEGPLAVATKGYQVGQQVVSVVRDEQGIFVNSGILSGLDRTLISANGVKNKGILQTDCPISLASAGAGVWAKTGALLGIFVPGNIPYASFRADSGVNFILPGDALIRRIPELIQ
jgi:hypothetical protein